jgi:hypothetical protein
VVELADTTDLKSVGFGLAGSIPAVRTSYEQCFTGRCRGKLIAAASLLYRSTAFTGAKISNPAKAVGKSFIAAR